MLPVRQEAGDSRFACKADIDTREQCPQYWDDFTGGEEKRPTVVSRRPVYPGDYRAARKIGWLLGAYQPYTYRYSEQAGCVERRGLLSLWIP